MSRQTTAKTQSAASARGKRQSRTGQSKHDQLIRMLSSPRGAGADAISRKFGWRAHTTRAALSRLRKAGYEVQTEKSGHGKPARYQIITVLKQGASNDAA